jgi:murein DD-endopeptidase MepM/ murein hydrolase activator NlpD
MSASALIAVVSLAAQLSAGQGRAVLLEVAHEPGIEAVEVAWSGHRIPFARRDHAWITVIGVDLDRRAGEHPAEITLRFDDGSARREVRRVRVEPVSYPTTRLTVEPRYVELSPGDQARASRESREIAEIYARLTPEAYWSEPFQVPIPGARDGRNFGHRRVFNDQPRAPHSGADLRAAVGTAIHAANRGRVVLARDLFFSGNAVFIDHGLGLYSVYLHLSEILVEPDAMVERGDLIGRAGATGRVTGPHLHWGARVLDARVDPFSLLELAADWSGRSTDLEN